MSGPRTLLTLTLGLAAALALTIVPSAAGGVDHLPPTKVKDSRGKFVPLPDEVLGAEDVYIDTRIRADLVWIARHFPRVWIGEGYAGPLPGGGSAGCIKCHVPKSDHKIGLGVDIYPSGWDLKGCDGSWNQLTRLAKLTEPKQGQTQAPFDWVGYEGDENHGCGNHLHLSWTHDEDYGRHQPSKWVETFDLKG